MNPLLVRPTLLGLLGGLIIAARWFYVRRKVRWWAVLPALLCVAYVLFRAWIFSRRAVGDWHSLDLYTLYADLSFGFNPSLWCNHWVERLRLYPLVSIVYEGLMLAIAATYAYSLDQGRQPLRVLALMVLAGVLGVQAYRLLPACGPVYLLGSACFTGTEPASCAQISAADLRPMPMAPSFPRNAMPSLHVAWALLVYWLWRPTRWGWVALLYLLLTMVATLAGGEHYLVDLVAAFPFALAIWILCGNDRRPARVLTFLASVLSLLVWIAVIRFAPDLLRSSWLVPWSFSALLVAGSLAASRQLKAGFSPADGNARIS